MSRSVCSNCSGRATAGSYSTSACSCVRLTATLSTPGNRPSAFSMVPVQSEQWRPPIRARTFRRSGLADGSSLQGVNVEADLVTILIESLRAALVSRFYQSARISAVACRFASHDPKAGLLDRLDKSIFLNRLWIVEHASGPFAERHRCHPHAGLFFNDALDRVRAGVAVHAFDLEYGGFHPIPRWSRGHSRLNQDGGYTLDLTPRSSDRVAT